jgi:hypothetical protein
MELWAAYPMLAKRLPDMKPADVDITGHRSPGCWLVVRRGALTQRAADAQGRAA